MKNLVILIHLKVGFIKNYLRFINSNIFLIIFFFLSSIYINMDREDKNINAAVRVSQVHNIDEEKLKFKVNVGIAQTPLNHGEYSFDLPPLTDLCNTNDYNQAIVRLDQIVISPFSQTAGGMPVNNPNPIWTDRFTSAADLGYDRTKFRRRG